MLQSNMLQTERNRAALTVASRSEQAQDGGIGELVNFAIALLRRQYAVILITAALALAACIVYLEVAPPTYTAQVQVLLGAESRGDFVQQQSLLAAAAVDGPHIETTIQILKSRAIAVAVINQLKLADDPDFTASGPLSSFLRRFRLQKDPEADPLEGLIAAFQDRLKASQVDISRVIEVSFTSRNAMRAVEIANAVASAYIADQLNARFEANRMATSWLQERLRDLAEQALTADRAVSAYKSQNNIVSSDGKPIGEQQIAEFNSRLVGARALVSEASAKLNRYETMLRTQSAASSTIGTTDAGSGAIDAAGSDALSSPIINNLRQQYLELGRRESEWSARFGRDHLAVINLRNRMRDVRTSILDEVKRLAEVSRGEFEVAKQRQQEIEKQLNDAVSRSRSANSAEITIRELESKAKSLHGLYETFLQRFMGSSQQETFPITETRVISPASLSQIKTKPKPALILALGIVGGLAFGIGLGLLRDIMDRVFRTSAQIESTLELPCLSLVPLLRGLKPDKQTTRSQQADDDLRRRFISTHSVIHHAVVDMPLSRFTEAIRSTKLAIDLTPNKTPNQVIGITSAVPGEGKTTIAAALAQLIGHSGRKVIIVDCDLRNPSLSASLAPNAVTGVIEIINGNRTIEETIWQDPRTNLVLLPVVKRRPLFHTSEIIAAEEMRRLFDRLRATYDYIIVDLPPLAPLVDVRVTSPLIDCFILVVEWGRSKIDVVEHALHTAPNIYESMIGVVLNKTDIKAMMRYDPYRSDYYSDTHYAHYGLSDSA